MSKTMTIPDLQGTEEYHAFFSYSSSGAEDEKKYEALFEFLEDRGLRVNFHRRDFLAQQTILENIHSAVESSRRVIVFWSKAYLKSDYVKVEADAIEEKIRKGNMNIAIHVLVDLSLEEVPKDVRRYTCLMYGDKEFRNQLLSNVTSANIPQMKAIEIGNVATGLAWSYFYGYLNLILPGLKERVAESKWWDEKNPKIANQLYILIPKSCFCPPSLSAADSNITHEGNLKPFKANRAGNMEREYRNNVYKVKDKDGNEMFVVVEYATPLLSLYEMNLGEIAGLSNEKLGQQAVAFYENLDQILRHGHAAACHGAYHIVYYDDAEGFSLSDHLSKLIQASLKIETLRLESDHPPAEK